MIQGYVIASLALVNSKITVDSPTDGKDLKLLASHVTNIRYFMPQSMVVLLRISQLGIIEYVIITHIDMDLSHVVLSYYCMTGQSSRSPFDLQLWLFYMQGIVLHLLCSKERLPRSIGLTSDKIW